MLDPGPHWHPNLFPPLPKSRPVGYITSGVLQHHVQYLIGKSVQEPQSFLKMVGPGESSGTRKRQTWSSDEWVLENDRNSARDNVKNCQSLVTRILRKQDAVCSEGHG